MFVIFMGKKVKVKVQWKESAYNAGATGDLGLIPGSRRSPGGGNGNPLQYSCQDNPMGRGAWRATVCRVPKVSDTPQRLNGKELSRLDFIYFHLSK